MKRFLLYALTALSLLLLLATAALWVRSREVTERIDANITWNSSAYWHGDGIGIVSWKGHVDLLISYHHSIAPGPVPPEPFGVSYAQMEFLPIGWWSPYYPTWNWCG